MSAVTVQKTFMKAGPKTRYANHRDCDFAGKRRRSSRAARDRLCETPWRHDDCGGREPGHADGHENVFDNRCRPRMAMGWSVDLWTRRHPDELFDKPV